MKRTALVSLLFFSTLSRILASDPLESLIESENKIETVEDNSELPPMFLLGDKNAVKIYSPGTRTLSEEWVCRALELDELIEMTKGDSNDPEIEINLSIPRVRKMFEDACLIRPDDYVVALAPGFQTPVAVKRFFVRREETKCSKESPFSLWAAFDEVLEQEPFLFSTDLDLPEGDNHITYLRNIPNVSLDEATRKILKTKIPFIEDFNLEEKQLSDARLTAVVHARRRAVETDDDGLPNELLFVQRDGQWEEIWVERVDLRNGSGHIRPLAVWDYNGDGNLDVLIEGDHQKCFYLMLLKGTEGSFEAENIPNEPCGC